MIKLRSIVCVALLFTFALNCFAKEKVGDNRLSPREKKAGWILLFDGKTYDGWTTSDESPSKRPIEAGTINPHRCGAYMVIHEKKWADFVLILDFKQSPECNSGVFFRVHSLEPQPGMDVGYNGLEVAIDDTKTAGYHDAGAIYDLSKPIRNTLRPIGRWNHLVLTCSGTKVLVVLNGEGVNAIDLADFEQNGLLVCLTASPETIFQRLENDTTRPLLSGDKKGQIAGILEARQPLYDAIAHQIDGVSLFDNFEPFISTTLFHLIPDYNN